MPAAGRSVSILSPHQPSEVSGERLRDGLTSPRSHPSKDRSRETRREEVLREGHRYVLVTGNLAEGWTDSGPFPFSCTTGPHQKPRILPLCPQVPIPLSCLCRGPPSPLPSCSAAPVNVTAPPIRTPSTPQEARHFSCTLVYVHSNPARLQAAKGSLKNWPWVTQREVAKQGRLASVRCSLEI